MNRREMLGRMAAVAAAGATTATVAQGHQHQPDVEPPPQGWRIEPVFDCGVDLSSIGVGTALAKLGWESGQTPKPLLCVSPRDYALGLEVAAMFGGVVQAWATNLAPDEWGWAVKWRGRMVGSEGA